MAVDLADLYEETDDAPKKKRPDELADLYAETEDEQEAIPAPTQEQGVLGTAAQKAIMTATGPIARKVGGVAMKGLEATTVPLKSAAYALAELLRGKKPRLAPEGGGRGIGGTASAADILGKPAVEPAPKEMIDRLDNDIAHLENVMKRGAPDLLDIEKRVESPQRVATLKAWKLTRDIIKSSDTLEEVGAKLKEAGAEGIGTGPFTKEMLIEVLTDPFTYLGGIGLKPLREAVKESVAGVGKTVRAARAVEQVAPETVKALDLTTEIKKAAPEKPSGGEYFTGEYARERRGEIPEEPKAPTPSQSANVIPRRELERFKALSEGDQDAIIERLNASTLNPDFPLSVNEVAVSRYIDENTGLLKRNYYARVAEPAKYESAGDFSKFKLVNDNFGKEQANEYIYTFGKLFRKKLREHPNVKEAGRDFDTGDEFRARGDDPEALRAFWADVIDSARKDLQFKFTNVKTGEVFKFSFQDIDHAIVETGDDVIKAMQRADDEVKKIKDARKGKVNDTDRERSGGVSELGATLERPAGPEAGQSRTVTVRPTGPPEVKLLDVPGPRWTRNDAKGLGEQIFTVDNGEATVTAVPRDGGGTWYKATSKAGDDLGTHPTLGEASKAAESHIDRLRASNTATAHLDAIRGGDKTPNRLFDYSAAARSGGRKADEIYKTLQDSGVPDVQAAAAVKREFPEFKAMYKGREPIKAEPGMNTAVSMEGENPLAAKYTVVELDDLVASHNPRTWARHPNYPEGVQERVSYEAGGAGAQHVLERSRPGTFDSSRILSDDPTPVGGPPIVTPDGIVLGGNGRKMMMDLVYDNPTQATRLKSDMGAAASKFGLDPAKIAGMKKPVIVRMIEPVENADEMARLGSKLNVVPTKPLSEAERAVSKGRRLAAEGPTIEAIDKNLSRLAERDPNATLSDVLNNPVMAFDLVKALKAEGVIDTADEIAFLNKTRSALSDEGREFIMNILRGRAVGDVDVLSALAPGAKNKIAAVLGPIVRGSTTSPAFANDLQDAFRILADANRRGIRAADSAQSQELFETAFNPSKRAIDMAVAFDTARFKELKSFFNETAKRATEEAAGQEGIFGDLSKLESPKIEPETPATPKELPPEPTGPQPSANTFSKLDEITPPKVPPKQKKRPSGGPGIVAPGTQETWGMIQTVMDSGATAKALWRYIKDLPPDTSGQKALEHFSAGIQTRAFEVSKLAKKLLALMPDKARREALTNFVEAGGDENILRERIAKTSDTKLRRGYEDALTLTPEEKQIGMTMREHYEEMLRLAREYGVLGEGKENYFGRHAWVREGYLKRMTEGGKLKRVFDPSKKRTYDSFFDGEQAGLKPQTKDAAEIAVRYTNELDKVIETQKFKARLLGGTVKETDGTIRPLAVSRTDYNPEIHHGYEPPKSLALADIRIHPMWKRRIDNAVGMSEFKKWLGDPAHNLPAQLGKDILRGLDETQIAMKTAMMAGGLFHYVTEGVHAYGHGINPFGKLEAINLHDPFHADAVQHGLQLVGNRRMADMFADGLSSKGGILGRIPGLGKALELNSEYLFEKYIPSLKIKLYRNALERNLKRFAKQIDSGEVNESQVKRLTASQSNNAFGELNYIAMARNPTFQHFLRIIALAPDFSEARFKGFLGQALSPGVKGTEQRNAMLKLAVTQMIAAQTINQLATGETHMTDHPFDVVIGNRVYKLRTVPGDIEHFLLRPTTFISGRMSPLVRLGTEAYTGEDYAGRPLGATTEEKAKAIGADALASYMPMAMASTIQNKQDLRLWEHLLSSLGLPISRYSPEYQVRDWAAKWNEEQGTLKPRVAYPESKYKRLRNALDDENLETAKSEFKKLVADTGGSRRDIVAGFRQSINHTYTGGSFIDDTKFRDSLTPEQRKMYDLAEHRKEIISRRFAAIASETPTP